MISYMLYFKILAPVQALAVLLIYIDQLDTTCLLCLNIQWKTLTCLHRATVTRNNQQLVSQLVCHSFWIIWHKRQLVLMQSWCSLVWLWAVVCVDSTEQVLCCFWSALLYTLHLHLLRQHRAAALYSTAEQWNHSVMHGCPELIRRRQH